MVFLYQNPVIHRSGYRFALNNQCYMDQYDWRLFGVVFVYHQTPKGGLRLARRTRHLVQSVPCAVFMAFLL